MVDFLLIGFYNCISYNNIHPLLRSGKFGFGYNKVFDYEGEKSAPGGWFSNISDYCPPPLILKKDYNLDDYRRFDERPDIKNIDSKDDIPDYDGLMGVPVSVIRFLDRREWDIVGVAHRGVVEGDLFTTYVDCEFKFTRLIIRKINNQNI